MNRTQLINSYFQKKDQLTVKNVAYIQTLNNLWQWLTASDDVKNDTTTNALNLTKNATAHISAKQDGVIAGIEEIIFLISSHIAHIRPIRLIQDGNIIQTGDGILKLSGPTAEILMYERAILNILGRMSGIATTTHNFISKLPNLPNPPLIAATRKTPWMLLDKKAVAVGGGLTHRLSLSDSVLIKDNHLMALQKEKNFKTLEETIQHTVAQMISKNVPFFEIEVATIPQAHAVLSTLSTSYKLQATNSILALMLDNWQPNHVKTFIEKIKKTPVYNRVLLEASGDITEKNLKVWSQTGVDILSIGALTHSSHNFNLSLKIT